MAFKQKVLEKRRKLIHSNERFVKESVSKSKTEPENFEVDNIVLKCKDRENNFKEKMQFFITPDDFFIILAERNIIYN